MSFRPYFKLTRYFFGSVDKQLVVLIDLLLQDLRSAFAERLNALLILYKILVAIRLGADAPGNCVVKEAL